MCTSLYPMSVWCQLNLHVNRFTIGVHKVRLSHNGKPTVKGNGSWQCRDSPILPLASSKTLMTPSWIWSDLLYSVLWLSQRCNTHSSSHKASNSQVNPNLKWDDVVSVGEVADNRNKHDSGGILYSLNWPASQMWAGGKYQESYAEGEIEILTHGWTLKQIETALKRS